MEMSSTAVAAEVIFYGNTVIDCDTRSIIVGHRREYLAPKEYTILQSMLALSGRPLEPNASEKRDVAVHLCRIRKKLRQISSNISIKSIRDRGYCLVIE